MSNANDTLPASVEPKKLLIDIKSKRLPFSVPLLNQWQYMERMTHRLLAAWGRRMDDWDGKATLHRHVWDQAEIIRRIRERIKEFPGGKPDAGVSSAFEKVADIALHAPSFEDAIDGIYSVILQTLTKAYVDFVQNAHPIHDAPSLALFHEINTLKAQHFAWYRGYRRSRPHAMYRIYEEALRQSLAEVGNLLKVVPVTGDVSTLPCRPDAKFVLPKMSSRPKGWVPHVDMSPYFSSDFSFDVEARRFFWAFAYLQEMNLPDDQLAWLYYGDYMPWEWHHDISRHLWDESRHGCSGYSRLQDWGISLSDVGFWPYSGDHLIRHPEGTPLIEQVIRPFIDEDKMTYDHPMVPLTRKDIYDAVFFTGMVAETGHFIVKNEGYDDFREAGDLASAEMMLFDIIDETAHVQYAHHWLPLLGEHAQVDNTNYRERAVIERKKVQERENRYMQEAALLPRDDSFEPWRQYQYFLAKIRKLCPIQELERYGNRTCRPM
jgi:hypothetical protein